MDAVIICRCYMSGKRSMVMTVDPQLRDFLGIVARDILGFRLRTIKGRRVVIAEKIPLHAIANPSAMLSDVLPIEDEP